MGAGILGLAHALCAHRAGQSVVVIDRDAAASSASIRNFGLITVTGQGEGATWQRARRSRDTPVGVGEGANAGAWTVGITLAGNMCGLSEAELVALSDAERGRIRDHATTELRAAGADLVIDRLPICPRPATRSPAGWRAAVAPGAPRPDPGPATPCRARSLLESNVFNFWRGCDAGRHGPVQRTLPPPYTLSHHVRPRPMFRFPLPILLVILCFAVPALAAGPPGQWLTEDHHGVIEISPCGANLCGRIVGIGQFRPNGSAPTDVNGASDCHLWIMPAMHPAEPGLWRGDIFDPESGKTYDAEFQVDEQDRLRLRGYIGIPLLGSTQIWTRFRGQVTADCHMNE